MNTNSNGVKLRRQRAFDRSRQQAEVDDVGDVTLQRAFAGAAPYWRRSAHLPSTFDSSMGGRSVGRDEWMSGQQVHSGDSFMRPRGSWDGVQQTTTAAHLQPPVTSQHFDNTLLSGSTPPQPIQLQTYQTSAAMRATPAPAPWRQLAARPKSQIITSSPYLPWIQEQTSRSFEEKSQHAQVFESNRDYRCPSATTHQPYMYSEDGRSRKEAAASPLAHSEQNREESDAWQVSSETQEDETVVPKEIEYIPPAPHQVNKLEDRELANKVATLNSRESKKKQLIAKLAAIRNELTSRISSFDSKEAPDASTALQQPRSDPGGAAQHMQTLQSETATSAAPAQTSSRAVSNEQEAVSSGGRKEQAMAKRTTRREMIKRTQTLPVALGSSERLAPTEHEHEPRAVVRCERAQLSTTNNQTPTADLINPSPFATSYSPLPRRRVDPSQTPVRAQPTSLQVHARVDSPTMRSPRLARRGEARPHGALSLVNTIQARLTNKAKSNSLDSNLSSPSPSAPPQDLGLCYFKGPEKVKAREESATVGATRQNEDVIKPTSPVAHIRVEHQVTVAAQERNPTTHDVISNEQRRQQLYSEDVTRDSSPEYAPIALPRDSVILRNKLQRRTASRDSSSSDESQSTSHSEHVSPRLSPRCARRLRSNRGSTSSASVSADHMSGGGSFLTVPGQTK